jgi:hypothetical protein
MLMNTKILALLFLLSAFSIAPIMAQGFPTQVFTASMEMTGPYGTRDLNFMSDGRGHMRTDSSSPAGKQITITDFKGQKIYMLMVDRKTVMQIPFNPQNQQMATDEAFMHQHNATSLGAKVIDGHPCHGWKYTIGDTTTESWLGDDIHYIVQARTTGPAGTSTMHLLSYSKAAPEPTVFQVPADYQQMNLPIGAAGSTSSTK